MNRHLIKLFIFSFVTSFIHGMDKPIKPRKTSDEMKFFQLMPFPQVFEENISSDVSGKVFDTLSFGSPTLIEGARIINHFSCVCKSMNSLVHDNTMPIIKRLSKSYKCSDEYAAYALETKKASKILLKQLGFAKICSDAANNSTGILPAYCFSIKKSNTDLDFTYGNHGETQLMLACRLRNYKNYSRASGLVEWLIKEGADINVVMSSGETAPYMALDVFVEQGRQLIEYFWDHASFNVNDIRWSGYKKTLLMHIILCLHYSAMGPNLSQSNQRRSIQIILMKGLLARGADPELGHHSKKGKIRTPLSLAIEFKDQEAIDILEDAIAEKHAREKKILQAKKII